MMVQIIMSTYNGEKYIREQLDSLLAQTYPDISILIRDDCSTDHTCDILEEYSRRYKQISYYRGNNIGATDSFYDLLTKISPQADYIATCDQDDVWLPEKVERAVEKLSGVKKPALYCGKTQLVDKQLHRIEDRLRTHTPVIQFGNAVIENICTGCTMVINRALYELVRGKLPKNSLIHDWWLYQVAVCFGVVIYDETPYIYYRQHENNEIGMDKNHIALIKRQLRSLRRFRGKYTAQMQEFIWTFSPEGENGYLAGLMVGTRTSWKCRFRILTEKRIFRQGRVDTILFKGMLFFGIL